MFSIVTVASSTRIPTAKASPPKVMILSVSPSALSTTIEQRMERGIEIADNQSALPTPKEKENHHRRQTRSDHGFPNHALDRGGDENRLVGQQT